MPLTESQKSKLKKMDADSAIEEAYRMGCEAGSAQLRQRIAELEADKKRLEIVVFYLKGDEPFICGVYGRAPLNSLADIEAQLCQSIKEEDGLLTEEGEYRFTARYEPAQRGDFGRIEFEDYWDLTQVSFTPLDAALPSPTNGEQHG